MTVMHTSVLSSYDLQLDLVQVIQLRVREGFNIGEVTLLADDGDENIEQHSMEDDGDTHSDAETSADAMPTRKEKLSVKVTLEWQPSVRIEYHVYEKRFVPIWNIIGSLQT